MYWTIANPKPISATAVRCQDIIVRSSARRVRTQAKWLSAVTLTSNLPALGAVWESAMPGANFDLLPCHSDADSFLRRDEVIRALGRVADGELHSLHRPVKSIAARAVVLRDGGAAVLADVAAVVGGKDHCLRHRDSPFADLLAVDIERHLSALAETAAGVGKLHAYLVLARRQHPRRFNIEMMHPGHVVAVFELAFLRVETPA